MPTYLYRCSTCENRFEAFQKFSDNPLTDCPECGGTVRRVIQPVGVVFKGTGWYINDSRKKQSDAGDSTAKTSDSADSGSKTSEAKSADSKPAETTSSKESTEAKPAPKTATKAASAAD